MANVKLYPQLAEDGSAFRLAHITEGMRFLEEELANYTRCKKRYNFCYNTLFYIHTGSTVVSAGCSISSIGLFATGAGALFSIPLIGVGLGSELFAVGVSFANKKILLKLKKHEAIAALVSAKLNSVKLIISKAIDDGKISDEEFVRIRQDIDDYKAQKRQIQSMTRENQSIEEVEKIEQIFLDEMKGTLQKLTETNKSSSK